MSDTETPNKKRKISDMTSLDEFVEQHFLSSVPEYSFGNGTLSLAVGPQKKGFHVHKDLLVAHSDYFAKVTAGSWLEAQSRVHTLEDLNVEVFTMFVTWLYIGKIHFVDTWDLDKLLINAWACGDRLQAAEFKNVVVNALYHDWQSIRDSYPGLSSAILAYRSSTPTSPLRKLVIDKFSSHFQPERIEGDLAEAPDDFKNDLLVALAARFDTFSSSPANKVKNEELKHDICKCYHEHKDEQEYCTPQKCKASFEIMYSYDCNKIDPLPHPFQGVSYSRESA